MESVDSTHQLAVRLIEQMDAEDLELRPTLILAGRQAAGIGRRGRRWDSPAGGLYLNWVGCGLDAATVARLPVHAAAAAHAALSDLGIAGLGIKWPNDILIGGRKLAGVLVHARHGGAGYSTVGLGVNLEPVAKGADSALPPTSVADHLQASRPDEWAEAITVGFTVVLKESLIDARGALDRWRRHLVHRTGDHLTVELGSNEIVSGSLRGITDDGFLELDTDDGVRTISAGDVVE